MLSHQNILKTFCLILLLSLISGTGIFAQRYPVRTYTESDGLANSMIFDLKQDSSGLIWIARRSGISSYDGIRFKNYNVSDGLKSTSYAYLCIDSKNKIWALVESGELVISTFLNGRWMTIASHRGLPSVFSTSYSALDVFYQNDNPVVLVGSEKDGLFTFQNGLWKHFTTNDGLPGNYINCILQFEEKVFVATEKGLCIFENNSFKKDLFKVSPYLSKKIVAMGTDGKVLWLLGDNWLGFLYEGKFSLANKNFRLPVERNGGRCFLQPDRMGRLYFGNLYKVLCFNVKQGKLETLARNNGLISEGGRSVLVDREFNIWIGGFRGITKVHSRRFASFYAIDGLFSNEVASGLEYSPGHYVFGHDGALTFYDGRSFSKFFLDHSPDNGNYDSRVLDISKDTNQNIWVAVTLKGVAKIDQNKKISWYNATQGLEGIATSVLSMSDGKIFAGTSDGLFRLSGERFIKLQYHKMTDSYVRKVFPGKENSIFFSTIYSGIVEIRNDKAMEYRSRENPLANNVFSFLIDSRNNKWVGTAAGLYFIRGTSLVRAGNGFPEISRPVYLILEDHTGRLWFGCDNGIYRWDGKNLDHFSTSEGISGQEINRSAGFMDFQHNIWFGTNNGLTVYYPASDYDLTKIPPPLIKLLSVESGNDILDPELPLRFSYNQNNLTFHFRAISFIDERQVVFQHKLEGLDTGWSQSAFYLHNSVTYNNLTPGTYKFFVKAQNSLGIWSQPVCSAVIKINQPFWYRWWFLTIIIIVLGGIGILTGRYFLIIRYNARLEAMVLARTRELERSEQMLKESNQAKDNFFSIIAHDLKSPFNVILGMLELLTQEYAEYSDEERQKILLRLKNASTRTIDLLENLLTWARVQKGLLPFSPQKVNITEIIDENVLLFESAVHNKDILITQSGEKNLLVMADYNMVNTIVRNIISNAIKFTFPGGNITVNVSHHDKDNILVSVKDTGFGMSPEIINDLFKIETRMVTKGTNNEIGTGLGLILCKDFIIKNNGKIWVTSEEGTGSCFYFTLPLYPPA